MTDTPQAARRGLDHRIPPPVVFAVVAAAMGLAAWRLPASGLGGPVATALGVALLVLAALSGPTAVLRFRRAGTTLDPLAIEHASVLVTDGVYRFTRNPMYLMMAALLGAFAAFAAQPLLLAGPVAFIAYITRFQILPEERVLQARFGAAYDAYRARVRRWL